MESKILRVILVKAFIFLQLTSAYPGKLTLLIVSNGLRQDYVGPEATPNLEKLSKTGLTVKDILPVFPPLRYPNLASLITGAYPEKHNVLADSVFDEDGDKIFRSNDTEFWESVRNLGTIWVNMHLMFLE